ncbi:MAG: carboxypeptidase regulatory-like domain-containing protein [Gemmatimonadetes bacterium]|nr:carboxypeptidase regulatory-like domain-containing protein [Gemmatimonadota bacterium]
MRIVLPATTALFLLFSAVPAEGQEPAPAPTPAPAAQAPVPTGRVTGRIIDRETGRPIQGVRVSVVGIPGVVETDLDGRYRTAAVPATLQSVLAAYIGYSPTRRDSVKVIAGQTITVDFALSVKAVELEELAVEGAVPSAPKTDAGLLAAQQAAPGVSDGISAEAISRSPDSDGSDVIRRVTGVTVFDKKFVLVRGLNERYSNTTLNGADLPSPEPLKKVAPLDIFPASLLESIVTAKTATPDKPGDFAGGSVEIRTKDFPENWVMQVGVSQGFNSLTTFQPMAQAPRTTSDFFGFGDARRRPNADAIAGRLNERALESYRNVWTGRRVDAAPNLGVSLNIGGQFGEALPIGFSAALTYGNKRSYTPGKLLAYIPNKDGQGGNGRVLDESAAEVEVGALANLSIRLGSSSKLGWKNLYTRNAEEILSSGSGYNTENATIFDTYGAQYVERELMQSQLSGEHVLGFLAGSRLEWKGTLALARRREPDQRRANYIKNTGLPTLSQFSVFQTRDLEDQIRTGQADLTVPFSLRHESDAILKFGGLLRDKPRTFTSSYTQIRTQTTDEAILSLPPERLFAPENMGSVLTGQALDFGGAYASDDDLTAFYGMADLALLPSVRVVGGLRVEHWRLNVFEGGRQAPDSVTWLRPWDYLWSANLTWSLSDRINIRLAGFRSVVRPDPRELVNDRYVPIGSECDITGDPGLRPARILNLDARWEFYPRPAELFAISGFYKRFDDPLVEVIQESANVCTSFTANGGTARNYGVELEGRRALDFLPGFLGGLAVGVNATMLQSEVTLDPIRFGGSKGLGLQGQSPLLLNGSLSWANEASRTSISLLYNFFDTRIARYGGAQPSQPDVRPANVLERARYSLDAKVQQGFGPMKISVSGTNLTGQQVRWVLEGSGNRVQTRRAPIGTSWSVGVTYDVF